MTKSMTRHALAFSIALIGLMGVAGAASAQPHHVRSTAAQHQSDVMESSRMPADNATANASTDAGSLLSGNAEDHDPHWGPAEDADEY